MKIDGNPELEKRRDAALSFLRGVVSIPADHSLTSTWLRKHDDLVVFIFRFEKKSGECNGVGGEYFAASVDMDATRVMGFMHVDRSQTGPGLPSEEDAKTRAYEVLPALAPDLADRLTLKWILPLNEVPQSPPRDTPFTMTDDNGVKHAVTAVRVKFHDATTNRWAWILVGRGGELVGFEREIVWNTVFVRRSTEAWLLDEFVLEERQELGELRLHSARRAPIAAAV